MKVGEYVRIINTLEEYVEITKVKKIFPTPINEEHILDYRGYEYNCDEIIKSSPNIIDLIEIGDYVNGSRVEEIEEYNGEKYLYLEEMEYSNANQDYINVYCKQEYIKSIVTKEQFSQIEYRIGE